MGDYMNNYSLKRFIFLFMNFNYCCCLCGDTENIECHHIIIINRSWGRGNYYRLKDLKENYFNIKLLCKDCHIELHRFWELI